MFENIQGFGWISIGSIFGANIRLELINQFHYKSLGKWQGITVINLTSTLLLGYILGIDQQENELIKSYNFILLFSLGLLGSLSTFSSFIFEIFSKVRLKKISDAVFMIFFSITSGLILAYIGYSLSYAFS